MQSFSEIECYECPDRDRCLNRFELPNEELRRIKRLCRIAKRKAETLNRL